MGDPLSFGTPIAPVTGTARVYSANAVTPAQQQNQNPGGGAKAEPPTQLALGTTLEAILRTPSAGAKGLPAGTHLLLRVVAVPATPTDGMLTGTVIDTVGNETLVVTPLGLLALQRRLSLPAGTHLAFEQIEVMAPQGGTQPDPASTGEWSALEDALTLLETASPALAAQLREPMMPQSGPELAGSLLFLWGAFYQGVWPSMVATTALGPKLAQRLNRDTAALRRLSIDPATGAWNVLTLPLLSGNFVKPLRLFVPRRKPAAAEGIRFAIEVELSVHGPMQLDGLLRKDHLILVVRSHIAVPPALRETLKTAFQSALGPSGLQGDISFVTTKQFLISPLDSLRQHVEIDV
jgi:hypothetical protein